MNCIAVSFHPVACNEVVEASSWYEERSPISALGFVRAVEKAMERIAAAPGRYARAEAGTRRILLERYPFSIYYRQAQDGIEVVAVAHHKPLPGYWGDR